LLSFVIQSAFALVTCQACLDPCSDCERVMHTNLIHSISSLQMSYLLNRFLFNPVWLDWKFGHPLVLGNQTRHSRHYFPSLVVMVIMNDSQPCRICPYLPEESQQTHSFPFSLSNCGRKGKGEETNTNVSRGARFIKNIMTQAKPTLITRPDKWG
jgi:hypothetical protein